MKKGYYKFTPKGKNEDIIAEQAKPSVKAGNPILDENYNNFRDDLIETIRKMTSGINKTITKLLPSIDSEIENIIKTNSKDSDKIAHTLDNLMNYMFLGQGEKQFLKLLDYYKTIDKESYNFYYKSAIRGGLIAKKKSISKKEKY